MKLYMFRTVPLPIIRSLCTVHSAMVYVIDVCKELSRRTRMGLQFHPGPARKLSTNLYDIPLLTGPRGPVPLCNQSINISLLSVHWINSWWWTEELSETCRVSCQNKICEISAFIWFYYKEICYERKKKSTVQLFKLTHAHTRARTHTHTHTHTHVAQVLLSSLDLRPQWHRKSPVSVITQLSEPLFWVFFLSVAQQPTSVLGRLIVEIPIYRTKDPVWFLWTSYQLISGVATYTTQLPHKRRTSVPSAEFEPTIPAIKWLQTCDVDRPTTGIVRWGLLY
jgi:hypothetical protein